MSRRYGAWAGNPNGVAEKPDKCVALVWPKGAWISRQCSCKRGHGPNGAYCKRHGAIAERVEAACADKNRSIL